MRPFLTTHTGSLPRPPDLTQLLKDRLTGFELAAESTRRPPPDLADFPDLDSVMPPRSTALRYAFSAVCTGKVEPKDPQAVKTDIRTLTTAATIAGAENLFMRCFAWRGRFFHSRSALRQPRGLSGGNRRGYAARVPSHRRSGHHPAARLPGPGNGRFEV